MDSLSFNTKYKTRLRYTQAKAKPHVMVLHCS